MTDNEVRNLDCVAENSQNLQNNAQVNDEIAAASSSVGVIDAGFVGNAGFLGGVEQETAKEEIYIRKNKAYDFFKRAFDIFASSLAIIVLSPILLITAIIVKLSSKGPVLFKDKRVGKNGKDIKLWKFRSMYVDAESRIKDYLTEEEYQIWLVERKLDKDPRITKFGKFIRKTSIDELPQLFNILFGTISIIGPRAITQTEWSLNFTEEQQEALQSVKPGLSGYWAAYARSNATYETGERQKLEMEYLKKRGFWFDIKLIFVTVFSVLKGKGAK